MIRQAGFDMIWFWVFLFVVVEMAQITPPVGFNLFVLQGMANKDMGYIAKSAFPLFLLMILAVIIIIIFPEIALWLPQQMVQNINYYLDFFVPLIISLSSEYSSQLQFFNTFNLSLARSILLVAT